MVAPALEGPGLIAARAFSLAQLGFTLIPDAVRRPRRLRPQTKIVQGWPRLWINFKALVGIFSQNIGPSLAIRANPVQFPFRTPKRTDGSGWMRTAGAGGAAG